MSSFGQVTCGEMAGAEVSKWWDFCFAARLGYGTAWMKRAAWWGIDRRRHITWKDDALAF
jgi:hypothetical protein